MTKRRARTRKAPAAVTKHSRPDAPRRRDPLAREWVPLPTAARALGFDWRTIRRHIVDEDFVRVLGGRWYVRYRELVTWWELQRPTTRRPTTRHHRPTVRSASGRGRS